MFKSLAALVALVFGVSGCVTVRVGPTESFKVGERTVAVVGIDGFNAAAVSRPNPHRPNVFITDKEQIVADQEPIRPIGDGTGPIVLTWALDASSDYVFPDDTAIIFQSGTGSSPPPSECHVTRPKKKVIWCWYDKPAEMRKWKYAIKVTNERTTRPLVSLDPWIYQD